MISVCIPVYNEYIGSLIKALYFQKSKLKSQVEIVVIDDASDPFYKEKNRELGKYIDKYIELPQNVGRPKIRNLFVKHAENPYLLFLDSDSLIDNSQFLEKYIKTIKSNEGCVIVGGAAYSKEKPDRNKLLKWTYGSKIECKPASVRSEFPYRSFLTKNVLIPGSVLQKIQFSEALITYGHDDTFMGYELKKARIKIIHIDNPVINNDDLDANEDFLNKSAEAVEGLFTILDIVKGDRDFVDDVKLLVWVRKLYQMKLHTLTGAVLKIVMPFAEYYLKKGFPSLFLFSLFKLQKALDICSKTNACHYFDQ